MAKTQQQTAGMVLLHTVTEDDSKQHEFHDGVNLGKDGVVVVKSIRADLIEKVEPMSPLWARQSASAVHTSLEGKSGLMFVTETVEEVLALVNRQQDTMLDLVRRIAVSLEQMNQYGLKVDGPGI